MVFYKVSARVKTWSRDNLLQVIQPGVVEHGHVFRIPVQKFVKSLQRDVPEQLLVVGAVYFERVQIGEIVNVAVRMDAAEDVGDVVGHRIHVPYVVVVHGAGLAERLVRLPVLIRARLREYVLGELLEVHVVHVGNFRRKWAIIGDDNFRQPVAQRQLLGVLELIVVGWRQAVQRVAYDHEFEVVLQPVVPLLFCVHLQSVQAGLFHCVGVVYLFVRHPALVAALRYCHVAHQEEHVLPTTRGSLGYVAVQHPVLVVHQGVGVEARHLRVVPQGGLVTEVASFLQQSFPLRLYSLCNRNNIVLALY